MTKGVLLDGSIIKKVTGHNAKFIVDYGIGPGAVIVIKKAGGVIPKIIETKRKAKPVFPKVPYVWNSTKVDLLLDTDDVSEEHEIEKIRVFFSALKVEKFSEGLVAAFYRAGYKTIPDILALTPADIVKNVPRQGATSAKNIVGEFAKLKNPGVKLPDLMYASGCFGRGLGQLKLTSLYDEYGMDLASGWSGMSLRDISNSVAELDGFSESTGNQFAKGIKPFLAFYRAVKPYVKIAQGKQVQGKLTGQVVSFSGFRDKNMGKRIEELGGVYSESMTSKTTILLTSGPGVVSTKTARAERKGVKIMPVQEFRKKYGI